MVSATDLVVPPPVAVTAIGVSRTDGTSMVPLLVLPLTASAAGFSPLNSAHASSAVFSASGWIALYTVMYCSPDRIRWIAATSASWPQIGRVLGSIPAAFIAAIAPPAVPSLAQYAPSNPSLPTAVMNASISCCASSGFQLAAASSLTISTLPSSTLWAPVLNSVALLSVGEPLIMVILGLALPPLVSFSSSAWACSLPTRSLSNDT